MSGNFVGTVDELLDGPSCHICGAIMVPWYASADRILKATGGWICESCGATTGCMGPREEGE